MKTIGILCANTTELKPFLAYLENPIITEKAMLQFHSGQFHNLQLIAAYSGVCKVF
ncbi:MAG: hypothetical protein SO415_07825 [Oliverpabstia sp.]|nr:hypothetical protein [Oliverpabstia sp.]